MLQRRWWALLVLQQLWKVVQALEKAHCLYAQRCVMWCSGNAAASGQALGQLALLMWRGLMRPPALLSAALHSAEWPAALTDQAASTAQGQMHQIREVGGHLPAKPGQQGMPGLPV